MLVHFNAIYPNKISLRRFLCYNNIHTSYFVEVHKDNHLENLPTFFVGSLFLFFVCFCLCVEGVIFVNILFDEIL